MTRHRRVRCSGRAGRIGRPNRLPPAAWLLASACFAGTAPTQIPPTPAAIQACLDRARPALLEHLAHARGDVLALVCLAAVHDGVPRSEKVFRRAAERLRDTNLTGTYGAALRLMVLADDPDIYGPISFAERQLRADRDVKTILRNRMAGGFTYRKRNDYPDLSNTQYAILGLRAAVSLGIEPPRDVWRRVLDSTLAVQANTGGFGYTRRNRRKNPYASMTVAGIAVLEICRSNLPPDAFDATRVDKALQMAWRWMADNKGKIGVDTTESCLYFHYGLERAAVLCDVTEVDGRNWYETGAAMLIAMQDQDDGSWRSSWEIRPGALPGPGSPVDTAFAVLFLRRKFQKVLPARYPRLIELTAQSTGPEIAAAARHAVRVGEKAIPAVIKALRSPLPPRRAAAALALRELAGQDFGFDPKPAPPRSDEAIKSAEKWWLSRESGR